MSSRPGKLSIALTAVAAIASVVPVVRADDEVPPSKPVAIVTLAGVNRVFDDMDFVFEAAGRPEIVDLARGALVNVNELGGLERDKPMGFALYVQDGLIPAPVPVGFVPVTKIEDLIATMEVGPVTVRPDPDSKNRFEIVGPRRSFFLEVRGDYALIANDTVTFDMNLDSPVPIAKQMASKYDVAAALYVENVPRTTREFFLQLLKSSAAAELQQRDDEPDAVYALRRANGKRSFDMIEMMLTDARRMSFGWDTSVENKRVVIDFDLECAPDSGLAKLMEETTGRKSLFGPALDVASPFSLVNAWELDQPARETLTALFDVAEIELAKVLNPDREPAVDETTGKTIPVTDPAVTQFVGPLKRTAAAGEFDFFLQFEPRGNRSMVLVGGVRMRDADTFGTAMVPILERVGEVAEGELNVLETSVDEHRGVGFHRIQGKNGNPSDERLYGTKPSAFVGAGQRALWFAVGGEDAMPALKDAIDRVVDAGPDERAASPPPFQLVVNAKEWMKLPPDERAPEQVRAIFEDSFVDGKDAMRAEFRPTENGGRVRITLEEGFLKLMGKGIGAGVDWGEERRERREQRRREREAAEALDGVIR